jgi:hypothetical protein
MSPLAEVIEFQRATVEVPNTPQIANGRAQERSRKPSQMSVRDSSVWRSSRRISIPCRATRSHGRR